MKILARILLLGVLCLPAAGQAQSTASTDPATTVTAAPPKVLKYRFVPEQSSITFELPTSYKVIHGKADAWHGSVELDPARPGALRAKILIRADSIETGNARRDLDTRDKVLEAARFSEIVFDGKTYKGNLSKFEPGATLTAEISGDIQIHGVTKPVQTSVQCAVLPDHVVVAGAVPVFWKAFGMRDMSRLFMRVRQPMLVVFRLWAVPEP